ncbi:hypothetical protein D9M72_593340 [compost metagenome]
MQGGAVVVGRRIGFFQPLGDAGETIFQPVETRIGDRLGAQRVEVVDAAGEIVEPLGQRVVDAALVEGLDLAGNVVEVTGQIRLGVAVAALHHQGKLIQALFEAGGRFLAGEILDAGSQRLQAGTKTGVNWA